MDVCISVRGNLKNYIKSILKYEDDESINKGQKDNGFSIVMSDYVLKLWNTLFNIMSQENTQFFFQFWLSLIRIDFL